MKNLLFLIATFVTPLSFAESYLCLAEAAAGVEGKERGEFVANVYNIDTKWLHAETDGKWSVSQLGDDFVYFDYCSDAGGVQVCYRSNGWAGFFTRMNNTFEAGILSTTKDTNVSTLVVMKGVCSALPN